MEGEFLAGVDFVLLEFFEEAFIAEVEGVRVFPVMMDDVTEALDHFGAVNFDGKFAAGIKAAWGEIDGADDGAGMIGEKQLAVQLEVLEFVNFDADVVHDAETADTFGELFLF